MELSQYISFVLGGRDSLDPYVGVICPWMFFNLVCVYLFVHMCLCAPGVSKGVGMSVGDSRGQNRVGQCCKLDRAKRKVS